MTSPKKGRRPSMSEAEVEGSPWEAIPGPGSPVPMVVGQIEPIPLPGYDPGHAAELFARWQVLDRHPMGQLFWKGRRIVKHPYDVWNYIEAIHYTKPDLIIECGTFEGGSATMFADLMEPDGLVVTIDVTDHAPDFHSTKRAKDWPRDDDGAASIYRIIDSSTDPVVVAEVAQMAHGFERVMVVLDSHHSTPHVLAELEAYAGLVTPGCYLVVEDTNLGGNPIPGRPDDTDGPMGALRAWVPDHVGVGLDFGWDLSKHRFGMTFNPYGWLVRLEDPRE